MKFKIYMYKFTSFIAALLSVPYFVSAQAFFYDFKSFVNALVYTFFNPLMSIITGLIFIYFFLGVAKYIWHAGDMAKRKEGYEMLIHGIIAIAVSMSIWGIIYFLLDSFGFYI